MTPLFIKLILHRRYALSVHEWTIDCWYSTSCPTSSLLLSKSLNLVMNLHRCQIPLVASKIYLIHFTNVCNDNKIVPYNLKLLLRIRKKSIDKNSEHSHTHTNIHTQWKPHFYKYSTRLCTNSLSLSMFGLGKFWSIAVIISHWKQWKLQEHCSLMSAWIMRFLRVFSIWV